VYATRADKWCFIKIVDSLTHTNDHFEFFFECSLQLTGEAYFREMNSDCPFPEVKPEVSVVEEICYM
jgi:hypothetical protein